MNKELGENAITSIRRMTIDDYEPVYRLWLNTPGMGMNPTDDSREAITRYLRRNPTTCFVAECDSSIAGAILAGHDGRRGYLYHAAVATEHRNAGIGAGLVRHAIAALEKEGIQKVALVVFAKNETGNTFWEHNGFIVRDDLIYRNQAISDFNRIDT